MNFGEVNISRSLTLAGVATEESSGCGLSKVTTGLVDNLRLANI